MTSAQQNPREPRASAARRRSNGHSLQPPPATLHSAGVPGSRLALAGAGGGLTGATLFSGIGAPECAAPLIDWRWGAEIDPFASAVHAHHFPDIPNLGDVTKLDGGGLEPIDLLVFGSPCQSFSVAGKRLGMDDPRGNLALVALALVSAIKPRWFVFENVPGLFSSADGEDFAAFLRAVRECGYSGTWRVLDAQYFGVPQRRRRIFFVGHLGDDWRPSAAVLFEPESLSGHPPPRRETRTPVAALTSNGVGTCGADDNQAQAGHLIASTGDTAHCLNAGGMGRQDYEAETLIAFKPETTPKARSDGLAFSLTVPSASGGGQPQAVAMNLRGRDGGAMPELDDVASLRAASGGSSRSYVAVTGDITHALNTANNGKMSSEDGTGRGVPLVAFDTTQVTSAANRSNPQPGDPCHPLAAGAHAPLITGFQSSQSGVRLVDQHATLDSNNGPRRHNGIVDGSTVRRLTPTECERLQGFPDGWTDIPWRGKRAPDGRRYKALGNSMAVPVMAWILGRIATLHAAQRGSEALASSCPPLRAPSLGATFPPC